MICAWCGSDAVDRDTELCSFHAAMLKLALIADQEERMEPFREWAEGYFEEQAE